MLTARPNRLRDRALPLCLLAASSATLSLAVGCGGPPPSLPPRSTSPVASTVAPNAPARERDAEVKGPHRAYGLHLAPQPNLVYQLDCIAGVILCARVIFREFWATLGLDAADEAALATWKTLRARHGGEIRRVDRGPVSLPLLFASGTFDVAERQRIAGLVGRTKDAYEASIALLSTDADARALSVVIERFTPRFERWWRERGFTAGSTTFDGLTSLFSDPFLDGILEKAARFYEAELPAGPTLDVHVMVQPASSRRLTVAYQLEAYAAVEAPEGGKPEGLIQIVAHESFHYFFSRMKPERRAALLSRVCASEDPFSVAAFGVLDEALAAALGNGLVGRHYTAPEEFARRLARDDGLVRYRAASVVARALMPALEGFLERGVVVSSDEFLHAYTAAARATYEGGRPRPIDYVHMLTLIADPRFASATERLRDASNAGYPYLREYTALDPEAKAFLVEHPFVTSGLFVPSEVRAAAALEALGASGKHVAAVSAVARRSPAFVYALPRTPKSYAFLFVAGDPPAMEELVRRFAGLTSIAEGAIVELPKGASTPRGGDAVTPPPGR
jgi:hypothetical protein